MSPTIKANGEQALVLVSVLRALKIPAVFIQTEDMQEAARTESSSISSGHQMVESYVERKGLDNWDAGLYDDSSYEKACGMFLDAMRAGALDEYLSTPGRYKMRD